MWTKNSDPMRTRTCTDRGGDNLALTDFSLEPIYLLKISGPLTLIKLSPHSFATAEASMVFPHPGYPYSSSLRRHQNSSYQIDEFNLPGAKAQG
jgi:hypothetical protein